MLIPIYLIRACGRSPSATGWLLAPLGAGMMCTYPFMGALTKRFGIRKVSAGGALLAFAGTLPFLYLASHGLVVGVLAGTLFIRGVGLSGIGVPSISAAYASCSGRTCRWRRRRSMSCSGSAARTDHAVRDVSRLETGRGTFPRRPQQPIHSSLPPTLHPARLPLRSRPEGFLFS